MDLQFQQKTCTCLAAAVSEVQSGEQTQELRLSDGMPDVGRVLAAWGQPILRGKEWHSDGISLNCGMLVWVLYAPEDGTEPRCVDSWLPFQMHWDLPKDTPEGQIRVHMLPRFVDARSLSSRKLMLRAGVSVMAQAYAPKEAKVSNAAQLPDCVEVLRSRYPVRLMKEAGEKTFLMDEDLILPGSAPQPEKVIYYTLHPEITDQRVLGDKVVFRGNGNLHVLYRSEEGQLHNWDFPLPFSQYAQCGGGFSEDAHGDVLLCATSLELSLEDQGHMRLKCGLVGQYLVDDQELLEVMEDAYIPGRDLQMEREILELPAVLETRREFAHAEQMLNADVNLAADLVFLPDYPRKKPTENGIRLELPGTFQALYYDENGALQGSAQRWEGTQELPADRRSEITMLPLPGGEPQMALSEGGVTLKCDFPLHMSASSSQEIPMITAMEPGEEREPDPARPSLLIKRVGDMSLWEIAKESGSTMEAIQKANGLQDAPVPGSMILIPIA